MVNRFKGVLTRGIGDEVVISPPPHESMDLKKQSLTFFDDIHI